jgi:5'-methylthioadenosine phosphorylase
VDGGSTRLAVVGGHAIAGAEARIGSGGSPVTVSTNHGEVAAIDCGDWVLLQRHGEARYRSAFAIDHHANLAALAELGCDRILAVCSVGGLRPELGVGTWVCPDDFIALHLGISYGDGREGELVPRIDPDWRRRVIAGWADRCEPPLLDGGTYWQAIGPRFETGAEIRLIAAHADVIGMTMASECILAGELGLAYAAVCVVDNLANGIGETALSVEEFERGKAANREALVGAIEALVPSLVAS